MSPSTRYSIVKLLLLDSGYTLEDLVYKTDDEMKNLAAERQNDILADMRNLKEAGLWPMPDWLVKRGLKHHGEEAMESIIHHSNRDRTTIYA